MFSMLLRNVIFSRSFRFHICVVLMFFFSIIIYCFTRSSDTKVDQQDKIEEPGDDKKGR